MLIDLRSEAAGTDVKQENRLGGGFVARNDLRSVVPRARVPLELHQLHVSYTLLALQSTELEEGRGRK